MHPGGRRATVGSNPLGAFVVPLASFVNMSCVALSFHSEFKILKPNHLHVNLLTRVFSRGSGNAKGY